MWIANYVTESYTPLLDLNGFQLVDEIIIINNSVFGFVIIITAVI